MWIFELLLVHVVVLSKRSSSPSQSKGVANFVSRHGTVHILFRRRAFRMGLLEVLCCTALHTDTSIQGVTRLSDSDGMAMYYADGKHKDCLPDRSSEQGRPGHNSSSRERHGGGQDCHRGPC